MWRKACSAVNCLEADGPWVDASNPSGNCVQAQWMTADCSQSSCVGVQGACSTHSCVGVDGHDDVIRVRDTKQWKKEDSEGPILCYAIDEWDNGGVVVFVAIDRTEVPIDILDLREDGEPEAQWYAVPGWTADGKTATLYFDQAEVTQFKNAPEGKFALAGR